MKRHLNLQFLQYKPVKSKFLTLKKDFDMAVFCYIMIQLTNHTILSNQTLNLYVERNLQYVPV